VQGLPAGTDEERAQGKKGDADVQLEPGYVITVDNLVKMLSILMRLQCNLPVLVMGETGCGKSSLMRHLFKIIDVPAQGPDKAFHTLDVHGGMEDADILSW
jgi:MoxR-like ATPase